MRVEEIYEAAFDDERFRALPSLLAAGAGADRVSLNLRHGDGEVDILACSNMDPALIRGVVEEGWGLKDPWMRLLLAPEMQNRIVMADRHVAPDALRRSEFYNDFLVRVGARVSSAMGGAYAAPGEGALVTCGLFRDEQSPPFGARERDALTALMRHVVPVLKTRALLAAERKRAEASRLALSALAMAVITVRCDGRFLEANAAGEALLAQGDLLRRAGGVVTSPHPACARRLARLIAEATAREGVATGAVRVQGENGSSCLVTALPLGDGSATRKALLFVQNPSARDEGMAARLRAAFGLTPAEAELAILVGQGCSVAEMAEARHVSPGTVRQQVKAIAAKLDVSRQAQIAALVNAVPKLSRPSGGE